MRSLSATGVLSKKGWQGQHQSTIAPLKSWKNIEEKPTTKADSYTTCPINIASLLNPCFANESANSCASLTTLMKTKSKEENRDMILLWINWSLYGPLAEEEIALEECYLLWNDSRKSG